MRAANLVIIGAPRSGTNMLRDLVCRLDGCATWPCDEINFIWKHGNLDWPTDELPVTRATSDVARYIQGRFMRLRRRTGAATVVEKTCANSLRVAFVDRVLPDARYVFIVRNGYDAIASALVRWRAAADVAYLAKKARFVPWLDLPYYARQFAFNRLHRLVSATGRVAIWGPRFEGIYEQLRISTLEEVCAEQWCRCVLSAEQAFAELEPQRVLRLHYEHVVADPAASIRLLAEFIGCEGQAPRALDWIRSDAIGKGRNTLASEVRASLDPLVRPVLARYGYV